MKNPDRDPATLDIQLHRISGENVLRVRYASRAPLSATMMHKLSTHPRYWPLLAGLGLLYLMLSGCASQPKIAPVESNTAAARATIIQTAERMLGTPYRAGGHTPRGFDCSGLASYSYGNAGIAIPRTAAEQYEAARPIAQQHLQPGDLVFFNIRGRKISHVGIYIGSDQFVHAPGSGKRVRIESLNDSYWRERMHGSGHYFRM